MKKTSPKQAPLGRVSECPCSSGLAYDVCCEPLHKGLAAPDAESLMRSRYSAYALGLESYLMATWHPATRPASLDLASEPLAKWLGLEVRRYDASGDDGAFVEFVAHYRVGGRARRLHEVSRFVRQAGRWYYVDGKFPAESAGI